MKINNYYTCSHPHLSPGRNEFSEIPCGRVILNSPFLYQNRFWNSKKSTEAVKVGDVTLHIIAGEFFWTFMLKISCIILTHVFHVCFAQNLTFGDNSTTNSTDTNSESSALPVLELVIVAVGLSLLVIASVKLTSLIGKFHSRSAPECMRDCPTFFIYTKCLIPWNAPFALSDKPCQGPRIYLFVVDATQRM